MGSFELLSLPYELKRRTASFLSSKDAIHMAQTCRTLHSSMPLGCLEPMTLFENVEIVGDRVRGDEVRQGHFIPVVASRRVHSITLSFQWMDQGWGNRNGKVYVVASVPGQQQPQQPPPPDTTASAAAPFDGGRVIFESELAPHARESLKISFSPVEGERYHLWYKAGAGGGHLLRLSGGTVTIVVFDDSERSFTHNYRVLLAAGILEPIPTGAYFPRGLPTAISAGRRGAAALPQARAIPSFYPSLLLSVCRAMRRQIVHNGDVDDEVIGFFVDYDIPLTESSLMAIEELIQENLQEQARAREDQNRRNASRDPNVNNNIRIGNLAGLAMQMAPGRGVQVFDPAVGGWVEMGEAGENGEHPQMPLPVNIAEFFGPMGGADLQLEQFHRVAQQIQERLGEIADMDIAMPEFNMPMPIPEFDEEHDADGDDEEGEHMD